MLKCGSFATALMRRS